MLVAQNSHHRAVALLLGEQSGIVLAGLLVNVDEDMFGRGGEAVLNTTKATHRLLIGSRVEEANIERLGTLLQLGQKDRIGVRLATIKVLAIAGQTAKEYKKTPTAVYLT